MKIEKATIEMLPEISRIVQETIDHVYPKYYPEGAVFFFKNHHSDTNIKNDIHGGNVFVLFENDVPVATVTIKENHILRLFVLHAYQHKGYGRMLLDFAEKKISEEYPSIELDASFPAKHIYLKRGYTECEYHAILTDNGDYLCYDVMKKSIESSN